MRSLVVLRSVGIAWLTCQILSVCMASLAMCCPHARPGEVCPMHHAKQAESKCAMRSACAPSDASLVSMAAGLGLFEDLPITFAGLQSLDPVRTIVPSPLARANHPDAPPPKA
jgi:hypothetical protein